MSRLKLFAFFSGMAIASLVNPKEAQKMIDCANEGAASRSTKQVRDHFKKLIGATNRKSGQ